MGLARDWDISTIYGHQVEWVGSGVHAQLWADPHDGRCNRKAKGNAGTYPTSVGRAKRNKAVREFSGSLKERVDLDPDEGGTGFRYQV